MVENYSMQMIENFVQMKADETEKEIVKKWER